MDQCFRSANIHLTELCNYNCIFCHSGKGSSSGNGINAKQWEPIIEDLVCNRGINKLNFVGGEPLLFPELEVCIGKAKECGATTSIVTNGSLVDEQFLRDNSGNLDWIGLSIDSVNESNEICLGRHCEGINHLDNVQRVARLAKSFGLKTKLNVTVTKYCLNDCFAAYIGSMKPDRVKFFQVTKVNSINDRGYAALNVTSEEFDEFRLRNQDIVLDNGTVPVFETEADQYNTYLMLDSTGKCRINSYSGYTYIDYDTFWKNGTDYYLDGVKYVQRGGIYSWNNL